MSMASYISDDLNLPIERKKKKNPIIEEEK